MDVNIRKIIEQQRALIELEKRKLGIGENIDMDLENENHRNDHNHNQDDVREKLCDENDKENVCRVKVFNKKSPKKDQNLPLIEQLDCNSSEKQGVLEKDKQIFSDKIIQYDNPLTTRSNVVNKAMLRFGEYSPNNPELRVTSVPHLGIGEYEQRRNLFTQKTRSNYLEHLKQRNDQLQSLAKTFNSDKSRLSAARVNKYCQTDIKNINTKLVQYELHSLKPPEKEYSPVPVKSYNAKNDTSLTSHNLDQNFQHDYLNSDMDKPKSILSNRRTGSPRERYLSDLQHSYTPSFLDGFSFQESRNDEIEREKLKKESYQRELRLQIEEKRHIEQMRRDQEKREREMAERRLEQQLLRIQEEQRLEEQRRTRRDEQMRRHSEDLLRRQHELQQTKIGYRKFTDSETNVSCLRNTNVASKALSHYSPPVSRRNPYSFNSLPSTSVFSDPMSRYNMGRYDLYSRKDTLNRLDSLSAYDYDIPRLNAFSRYDSLSRIDSLKRQDTLSRIESLNIRDSLSNVHRRHSATQQDLSSSRRSPKLQRRSSSSRFDDTLPIPVLKAHSPVAKELKNSVPFNSGKRSEAMRKLEDKWQIPAVQKNIINYSDTARDGSNRSILTQLGAIRMQLQQEQVRMDETLRKRGYSQSKAVDFH